MTIQSGPKPVRSWKAQPTAHTPFAGVASYRLLAAGMPNGMLYGPRSPKYKTDGNTQP